MPLDYRAVRDWALDRTQAYTERDTMLYGVGVGFGEDPLDERQLRFVYEKNLLTVPTMSAVLCHPGTWVKEPKLGIDWLKVVHAEHKIIFHHPLPTSATVSASYRNTAVVDKGPGKGALIYQEKRVTDQASGTLLATNQACLFARGDGGFSERGGGDASAPPRPALPESTPDAVCDLATLPRTPLIYRLSGDYMAIHVDPEAARKAGFPRPIMHGLCTFAMAGHAVLRTFCDYAPARLASLFVRFSAPALPGETIRTEMWRRENAVLFRSRVVERDVVVLNNGVAELR